MAANDGSFRVVRYAFGDDEVDYSLFNDKNFLSSILSNFLLLLAHLIINLEFLIFFKIFDQQLITVSFILAGLLNLSQIVVAMDLD